MSAILSPAEMQAWEQRAFAAGVRAEALMDEAGEHLAQAVRQFFPKPGTCIVVFGKGNNGGDGLVAARHLAFAGWKTHLVPAFPREQWGELPRQKFEEAGLAEQEAVGLAGWQAALAAWRRALRPRPLVVLECLLGVGAKGTLRPALAELTRAMNAAREEDGAHVFAIDLPTGLEGDSGVADPACVVADFTLTVGAVKRGLVADGALHYVGRLALLPLAGLEPFAAKEPGDTAATPAALAGLLPRRSFDLHKGACGRVAIVAGSRGFTGAAVMCAEACVRSGAGLITLYVPGEVYPIVAATAIPEVMVHPVDDLRHVLQEKHDVLALGPGLGRERDAEVLELIRASEVPAIIDADGLNVLSEYLEVLREAKGPRLLTPHPGEMERLQPGSKHQPRAEVVRRFTTEYPATLLLKGSRTVIGEAGRPLSYNTTGTPGMATGGMGDVLTGILAALAGQKLSLYDAASVGAWIGGRAAELAIYEGTESEESLAPTAVLGTLGRAWKALHGSGY